MSSEPLDELVIQNVLATVAGIQTLAGYTFDAEAERELTESNTPRDGLVVVAAGDPEPDPGAAAGFDYWWMPVPIVVYAIIPDADERAMRTILSRRAADVRRALGADLHRGLHPDTGNGLAMNTKFDARDDFDVSAMPARVIVTPRVQYRHLRGNPYQVS